MIIVKNLKVSSLSIDFLDLSWKIEDTDENLLDYAFTIQRAEGAAGPFDTISPPIVDGFSFQFRDVQAPQYNRQREYYYRIEIRNIRNNQISYSAVVDILPERDLYALEIQRLEFLQLKEFTGRRVVILPRRSFGQRCRNCWDRIKQREKTSDCAECFGTGFARGFMQPLVSYVQIDEGNPGEQHSDLGVTQHNIVSFRAFVFPILSAGDIIIESEGQRWRVVGVTSPQHLRNTVAQQGTIFQIPETEIEYRIPLHDINFQTFQSAAERAFTNPQNIDHVITGLQRSSA